MFGWQNEQIQPGLITFYNETSLTAQQPIFSGLAHIQKIIKNRKISNHIPIIPLKSARYFHRPSNKQFCLTEARQKSDRKQSVSLTESDLQRQGNIRKLLKQSLKRMVTQDRCYKEFHQQKDKDLVQTNSSIPESKQISQYVKKTPKSAIKLDLGCFNNIMLQRGGKDIHSSRQKLKLLINKPGFRPTSLTLLKKHVQYKAYNYQNRYSNSCQKSRPNLSQLAPITNSSQIKTISKRKASFFCRPIKELSVRKIQFGQTRKSDRQ